MATRVQKIKVGVFLAVCIALIVVGVAVLQGYSHGNLVHYEIEFEESVLGLYVGGYVMYLGVPVGKVKDISVTEDNLAHVDIEINADKVTLHEGVKGQLVLYSLATGALSISLSGGDPGNPVLAPGSKIPTELSLLESVSGVGTTLLENVNAVTDMLRSSLEGMESGELARIIEDAAEMSENLRASLEGLEPGQLNRIIDSAEETTERLRASLDGLESGELARIIENTAAISDRLRVSLEDMEPGELARTIESTNALLQTLNEKLEPVDVAQLVTNLNGVLTNTDMLLGNLKEMAQSMNNATETVLYDVDDMNYKLRETLTTVNQALEAVRELVMYLQEDPSALIRGPGRSRGDR